MHRHEPWSEDRTRELVRQFAHLEGPLMPILHAVQETFGFVPEDAVPIIAAELNLSRAEVHGTVTFYHDFRRKPPGTHVLKICRAEACQAMGCENLVSYVEDRLGQPCGSTSPNEQVTLEAIYCLGLCATAPSAMINGRVIGRLTTAKVDRLLAEVGL